MLAGMGTVFVFLSLLVAAMSVMAVVVAAMLLAFYLPMFQAISAIQGVR